jgi:UDP-2,3-diacylglucosamine hydrolase
VPDFILSDVHLRYDRPERGARLARVVGQMEAGDRLVIVGDLCDFWLASRQRHFDPLTCSGLRALADFRDRGGSITILAGNHDAWLGTFYQRVLGASWVEDHLQLESHGHRLFLAHGHRLGRRNLWKAAMESRAFLAIFGMVPRPLARLLEIRLDRSNEAHRAVSDARHIAVYRCHADAMVGSVDLAIFGHIHRPTDDVAGNPRLIVLGGWHHRASYLRIDSAGASFLIEPDPAETLASVNSHPRGKST